MNGKTCARLRAEFQEVHGRLPGRSIQHKQQTGVFKSMRDRVNYVRNAALSFAGMSVSVPSAKKPETFFRKIFSVKVQYPSDWRMWKKAYMRARRKPLSERREALQSIYVGRLKELASWAR